ncbi:MAG: hypothetical protein AAF514_11270, partial [Verrucomicrobiota bacterium]
MDKRVEAGRPTLLENGKTKSLDWFFQPYGEMEKLRGALQWQAPASDEGKIRALRRLGGISDSAVREVLRQRILWSWLESDPVNGFDCLERAGLTHQVCELVRGWALFDLEGAFERAAKVNRPWKSSVGKVLTEVVSVSDPELCLEWTRFFQVKVPTDAPVALATMAENNPRKALELARSINPEGHGRKGSREHTIAAVMGVWFQGDKEAVLQVLRSGEGEIVRSELVWKAILETWLSEDPAGAVRLIEELVPANRQPVIWQKMVEQWAKSDPDAAFGWILNQPSGNEQRKFLTALGSEWARSDPEAALQAMLTVDSREMASALITQMVTQDWEGTFNGMAEWEDVLYRSQAAVHLLGRYRYWDRGEPEKVNQLLRWVAESPEIL